MELSASSGARALACGRQMALADVDVVAIEGAEVLAQATEAVVAEFDRLAGLDPGSTSIVSGRESDTDTKGEGG